MLKLTLLALLLVGCAHPPTVTRIQGNTYDIQCRGREDCWAAARNVCRGKFHIDSASSYAKPTDIDQFGDISSRQMTVAIVTCNS